VVLIRFTVLGVLLLLGGCQYVGLQSSQLSGIISVFNTGSEEQPEFTWSLQYGGYSAAVQPMSLEASTTFVNKLDTIAFDGGSITKVSGLSSFTPAWEIQDTGRVRSFIVRGRIVATHQCDPWLNVDVAVGFRADQQCTAESVYTNTILANSQGKITSIKQVVDSSLMVLQLRYEN